MPTILSQNRAFERYLYNSDGYFHCHTVQKTSVSAIPSGDNTKKLLQALSPAGTTQKKLCKHCPQRGQCKKTSTSTVPAEDSSYNFPLIAFRHILIIICKGIFIHIPV